jgi:hypothetical protein
MAQFAPDRVDRLVIGALYPFARSMEHLRQMVRAGIDGGADAFVAAFHKTFGPAEGAFAERLRAADLLAYLALLQDRPASTNCCRACRCLAASTLAMQMTYSGRHDRQASGFRVRYSFPSRGSIIARPSRELSLCCPGSCRSCWGKRHPVETARGWWRRSRQKIA